MCTDHKPNSQPNIKFSILVMVNMLFCVDKVFVHDKSLYICWLSAPSCLFHLITIDWSLYDVILISYTPLFSRIHGSPPDFFRLPANVFSTSKLPSPIRSTSSCNNLFLPFWAWLPRRHSCLHHLFLCIILCSRPLLSLSHQERHHLSNCLSVNWYSIFFYT